VICLNLWTFGKSSLKTDIIAKRSKRISLLNSSENLERKVTKKNPLVLVSTIMRMANLKSNCLKWLLRVIMGTFTSMSYSTDAWEENMVTWKLTRRCKFSSWRHNTEFSWSHWVFRTKTKSYQTKIFSIVSSRKKMVWILSLQLWISRFLSKPGWSLREKSLNQRTMLLTTSTWTSRKRSQTWFLLTLKLKNYTKLQVMKIFLRLQFTSLVEESLLLWVVLANFLQLALKEILEYHL